MKYVMLPDSEPHRLPFYLAMEEYMAINTREDAFFMWQVDPTVIFGRNQAVEKEVDLEYCRSKGIQFYRRKSGGGCVYADYSNIMFSFITTATDIPATFAFYTGRLAEMLKSLGIDASSSGRNDVTVRGRKVSGNAFYQIGDRSIVHGTMLYDTDIENMTKAISPSPSKLTSKGVDSVKSHITTLREENIGMSIDEFKSYAHRFMCDGELNLTPADVIHIQEIAAPYYTDEWIFGNNPRCSTVITKRIEGVGEFQTHIMLNGNKITSILFSGDYFALSDINRLSEAIIGTEYSRDKLYDHIRTIHPETIIKGLTRDHLLNLLF